MTHLKRLLILTILLLTLGWLGASQLTSAAATALEEAQPTATEPHPQVSHPARTDAADHYLFSGPKDTPSLGRSSQDWADDFHLPSTNGLASALAVAPDGTIYVGGDFTLVGDVAANGIAMWDGTSWSALGEGLWDQYGPTVNALAVASDGTLYVGGEFSMAGGVETANVAQWDGQEWDSLGSGVSGSTYGRDSVHALALTPDGTLYVGGGFSEAGGETISHLAQWDGTSWAAVGGGVNDTVLALAVAPDGTLYVGGDFTEAGGTTALHVAQWSGTAWASLGDGQPYTVYALAVGPEGELYASSGFGPPADPRKSFTDVSRWNGLEWTLVMHSTGHVGVLEADSDYLYATRVVGVSSDILYYDGTTWGSLPGVVRGSVESLAIGTDGALIAGGRFSLVGNTLIPNLMSWDGSNWSSFVSGMGVTHRVHEIVVAPDGTPYALIYVPHDFYQGMYHILRWEGSRWQSIGGVLDDYLVGPHQSVGAMAVAPDGTLYVGGQYNWIGGADAHNIARWDGAYWSEVGGGTLSIVDVLTVAPDGTLYAGGGFPSAGGTTVNFVARWDGAAWNALGNGVNGRVKVLAAGRDGQLYAAGDFDDASGTPVNGLAFWDGSSWSALGEGIGGFIGSMDVTTGGLLYVGGAFATAGTVAANNVARWDGGSWHALGEGVNGAVADVAAASDLSLYITGDFSTAGGGAANHIAHWNGSAWEPLGSGLDSSAESLAIHESKLWVGGAFSTAGDEESLNIARWEGVAGPTQYLPIMGR